MLIVKVEFHSARTGEVTEIGRMHIVNDGTGSRARGNYRCEILRRGSSKVQRVGSVLDYPRLSYPVWELVRRALAAALVKAR